MNKPHDSFVDFVMEQLRLLGDVDVRRLFGGYGLYDQGVFFGIISSARLYFKTNDDTCTAYVERGMQPFRPNPRQTLKTYYEVPVEILEDEQALAVWARQAISCQRSQIKSTSSQGQEDLP